jgi:murein DD-endopeptidase MepM/ murein hydrolase activator NlpD
MHKKHSFTSILLAGLALLFVGISCQVFGGAANTAGGTPAGKTISPSATRPAATSQPPKSDEATQAPEAPAGESPNTQPPAESLSDTGPCGEATCIVEGSFVLDRPVGANGRNTIDPSIRFGEYRRQTKDANHGVSLLNSTGIPVVAAADGEVVVAGDDSQKNYGPKRGYYGNLVILQHSLPGQDQPVYTLYSHLSQVEVNKGDQVTAGQEIGQVGMTGSVSGSTLHFEVRLGANEYSSARNPELWFKPLPDENGQPNGALVGRIMDPNGKLVPMANIVVEPLGGGGRNTYLQTYTDQRLWGLAPWYESFGVGDLPAGDYKISYWLNGYQQRVVTIESGKVTVVVFKTQ